MVRSLLLLSTANNYPLHLNQLIISLLNGNWTEAQRLSAMITKTSTETFQVVSQYNFDNPFTNSAKMVDFFVANGSKSEQILKNEQNIPMTKDGIRYNVKDLYTIKDILTANGIMNDEYMGYLNQHQSWWKKH